MKPSELLSFFHKDLFIPELGASTKDGALKEIAKCLESSQKVYRASIIYDLLKKREGLGSTAIGGGVAVPHCRSIAVEKLTVLFAMKSKGIDFKSADKKPVKLLFMVVAPLMICNIWFFWENWLSFSQIRRLRKYFYK